MNKLVRESSTSKSSSQLSDKLMVSFGELLKGWRVKRSKTQLDLATDIGTTARHLSFLETGRSAPTTTMIMRLCEALKIPFRERNALLRSAGFREYYRERTFDHPEMEVVHHAIDVMLNNHEPFPAVVMDRDWTILKMNRAGQLMIGGLLGGSACTDSKNFLMRFLQNPNIKDIILNWDEMVVAIIQRIKRESLEDSEAKHLIESLKEFMDVPEDYWHVNLDESIKPVIPIQWRINENLIGSMFSVISTFGTPVDVLTQELRIEMVYPANEATEQFFYSVLGAAEL